MMPNLKITGLSKRYGGVLAVNNVDLQITSGGIHAIIGPNGAGKTTFFNLVAGTVPPTSGQIIFCGSNITQSSEADRVRLGLVRSFQHTSIFPDLTVSENVLLASMRAANSAVFSLFGKPKRLNAALDRAQVTLEKLHLSSLDNQTARNLPHGALRLLDVAMALASEPKLLLLDEPTSGLSSGEAENFGTLLSELAQNYSILLIEHNVDLVMQLAQRITVFSFGEVLADGLPHEIAENPKVQEAYFGTV